MGRYDSMSIVIKNVLSIYIFVNVPYDSFIVVPIGLVVALAANGRVHGLGVDSVEQRRVYSIYYYGTLTLPCKRRGERAC